MYISKGNVDINSLTTGDHLRQIDALQAYCLNSELPCASIMVVSGSFCTSYCTNTATIAGVRRISCIEVC